MPRVPRIKKVVILTDLGPKARVQHPCELTETHEYSVDHHLQIIQGATVRICVSIFEAYCICQHYQYLVTVYMRKIRPLYLLLMEEGEWYKTNELVISPALL